MSGLGTYLVGLQLGLLLIALILCIAGIAGLTGGTPEPVRVIEVAPGDTLYDIAADLAQPGEIRAMVHRIQELNSLPGAQITEGQKLAVPRG
jgi:LysM repeat protein